MDKSKDLNFISQKYGLPPMEYSRKLNPGESTCNRITGRILISESFRRTDEADLLRAAFHQAGRYHTRSFEHDIALPLSSIGLSVSLVIVYLFPQVRALIPAPLLPISWVGWFVSSIAVLVIRPAQWERAANQWAVEHWPAHLRKKGVSYF
ncbi:hypothetical protein [Acidithiobacillus caldus]|uniref:hypothetical protein n=1 Tax=Acidithiobacillus caldus TaxID=33059 RepID=UPI001C075281|nr:hypothetical protein [Acidithiobacillus caldus]MBU2763392.1 hypothetical protein [Acidithiobacillus caldus]MBU2771231.1 hypothetical protein [Acidithiobacillus caldus]